MNSFKSGATVVAIIVILTMLPIVLFGISKSVERLRKSTRMTQSVVVRSILNNLVTEVVSRSIDVDGDGVRESVESAPGNLLPADTQGRTTDFWDKDIRFCVWDGGIENTVDGYAKRPVHGSPPHNDLIARVVSAGLNGSFETSCEEAKILGDDIGTNIYESDINAGVYSSNGWYDAGDTVKLLSAADNVSIGGTNPPTEKLEVTGGVLLGDTVSDIGGSVKFDGNSLYGFDGVEWKDLLHDVIYITGTKTLTAFSIDKLHHCTGTTSNYTVTLPSPETLNVGDIIRFRIGDETEMTWIVTLDARSGYTIDGKRTRRLYAEEEVTLQWTGSEWTKIARVAKPLRLCVQNALNKTIAKEYTSPNVGYYILYFPNDCGSTKALLNNIRLDSRTYYCCWSPDYGSHMGGFREGRYWFSLNLDHDHSGSPVRVFDRTSHIAYWDMSNALTWTVAPNSANVQKVVSLTNASEIAVHAKSDSTNTLIIEEVVEW